MEPGQVWRICSRLRGGTHVHAGRAVGCFGCRGRTSSGVPRAAEEPRRSAGLTPDIAGLGDPIQASRGLTVSSTSLRQAPRQADVRPSRSPPAPEHRVAADRRGLRYPSDLTDAEWAMVAPMIPPGRHGGRRRSVNVREVLNGIFYVLWTGCNGRRCPRICRRRARCTTISTSGTGTAPWSASITRCT